MKTGSTIRFAALCMAFFIIATGCSSSVHAAEPEPEPEIVRTAVETMHLSRASIRNELTYIGQVQPLKTVNIVSLLAAEVTEINYDLGDEVEEGDVLFTIDAKDIEDQIRQLQVALQAQNIGVESAQYGLELSLEGSAQERLQELQYESGMAQATAGMRQAEISRQGAAATVRDLEDARDSAQDALVSYSEALAAFVNYHREVNGVGGINNYGQDIYIYNDNNASVYNIGEAEKYSSMNGAIASSRQALNSLDSQIDQARTQQRLAQASEYAAENTYEITADSLDAYHDVVAENMEQAQRQAEFAVRNAQAQVASTQLQISIARDNLNRAIITSPIGGVVANRTVEVGQFVSSASVPFTIVQLDPVIVQVSVSETLINSVFPGQEVSVTVQALGEETLTGKVTAVSPIASQTSTFPIKIELDNAKNLIKPGMFAQVTFVETEKTHTFVVDKNVVMEDEAGQYVFVVRDGAAQKVPIETGLTTGAQIEIVSGITEADEIVVVGQEYLYQGTPVNVVLVDGEAPVQQEVPTYSAADEESPES